MVVNMDKANDFCKMLEKELEKLQEDGYKNQINYIYFLGECSAVQYLFDLDSPVYERVKDLLRIANQGRDKVINDILSDLEGR